MVSFSCDACQNVFTKPKVERHLQTCNTRTVSCIDCGVIFDSRTVRAHTSCMTEEQKYGPRSSDSCTQTYCGICKLQLNGAVHALQHYDSKKHRAAARKSSAEAVKSHADQRETHDIDEGKARDKGADGKFAGLTRVMKKALSSAKKRRLKRDRFLKTVAKLLGDKVPRNLETLVNRKLRKSKRFVVRKDRVMLADSAE